VHVGNRLDRSFLGVSVQVPPTVVVVAKVLGEELAGDGEEVLAQCLADVLRAEVDGSEGGGAVGAADISSGNSR
jgi:hypothetical protein